jgi:phosphonate degradation associated HDIG domain protein
MEDTLNQFILLYDHGGDRIYAGETVSQLAHAWQCGRLAEKSGANAALQLASWLHDIGHFLTHAPGSPTCRGEDDEHEQTGAQLLRPIFGPAVSEPVRLHVQAKRYLVSTRAAYAGKLSPDSVRSLQLQGGPMTEDACRLFESEPFFADAVKLRVWDDLAKKSGWFEDTREAALDHLTSLMVKVKTQYVTQI